MSRVSFTQSTIFIDPKTGQLTRDGFDLVQFFVQSVNGAGAVLTTDGTQVVTNKTIDGDLNSLTDIATSSLKTRTGIAAAVATGTAGGASKLAMWNGTGDIIDSGLLASLVLTSTSIGVSVQAWDADLTVWATKTAPAGAVVGDADAQTLTNKTVVDANFFVVDNGDATKIFIFDAAGITTGTTRTFTVPDRNGTLALSDNASALTGAVVQSVWATPYTANTNLATAIPSDDTIPQNTEGTQILTASITPLSTTNKVRARFRGNGAIGAVGNFTAAMFKDSGANAIAATYVTVPTADYEQQICIEHEFTPGSVSSLTIAVRVGPSGGTLRMNGTTAGRALGGVSQATLVLEEIKA